METGGVVLVIFDMVLNVVSVFEKILVKSLELNCVLEHM